MSPHSISNIEKLLEEADKQNNNKYQCIAMYSYVAHYFNHQDEVNTTIWADKLSELALKHKFYNIYFLGKRAKITMHIIHRKIEHSITEAEEMYKLANKLNNTQGMSSAKLCLMTAYMMTIRTKEEIAAGVEAYRLLPADAPLEARRQVLQEITLACSSTADKDFPKYLQEYREVLDQLYPAQDISQSKKNAYLLLESLYADYFLSQGKLDEVHKHLKEMDKFFFPESYIPCRGLYYDIYTRYYRRTQKYDKALICADSTISLLSSISDNGGLSYGIERAGILADAGRLDEAIPLYQELLAKKDSFYKSLSASQMEEIYQMHDMDNLLLEKEQHEEIMHYITITLIAIALGYLTPSTIRIFCIRKRLKKEEKKIREMTLIAEEANEVKSRFLANMSYNIRIPLNNVLGFSQLMTTDIENIDASQWQEYTNIIQSNSAELIQLVNDVLDLSRLEAGKTKWQMQDHDIIPLCSDVICMVEMRCGDKIELNFQTDIESQPIRADVSRLTQLILSTLIYSDPCEEKRSVSFSLQRNLLTGYLTFCIVNSPLADPKLQTQKVEVRHNINRLTIEYFKGTYAVNPDAPEGATVTFTYPYPDLK